MVEFGLRQAILRRNAQFSAPSELTLLTVFWFAKSLTLYERYGRTHPPPNSEYGGRRHKTYVQTKLATVVVPN